MSLRFIEVVSRIVADEHEHLICSAGDWLFCSFNVGSCLRSGHQARLAVAPVGVVHSCLPRRSSLLSLVEHRQGGMVKMRETSLQIITEGRGAVWLGALLSHEVSAGEVLWL